MKERLVCVFALLCIAQVGATTAWGQGLPRFDDRYFSTPCGPTPPPVSWLPYFSRQLVMEAQRLNDDVSYEFAGTSQGARIAARAQAVLTTARYLDNAARGGQPPQSPTVLSAVRGLDASLGGMRQALSNSPGFSPQTSRTLGRIERIAQDVRLLSGAYDNPYDFDPPTNPPCDFTRLRRALLDLAGEMDQLTQFVISSGIDRYPGFGALRSELSQLERDIDQTLALVDRQADANRLRRAISDVRREADQISRVLNSPGVPQPLVARWDRVARGVSRVERIFDSNNDPGPLPPGNFPPGPFPPGPRPPTLPPFGGQAIMTIDRINGEIEGFLATLAPRITTVPEGPQFQADARNLRSSVLRLRSQLSSGGPPGPRLRNAMVDIENQYQRLWDRTRRLAEKPTGPNIDRVKRIGALVNDLRAQLSR